MHLKVQVYRVGNLSNRGGSRKSELGGHTERKWAGGVPLGNMLSDMPIIINLAYQNNSKLSLI